MAIPFSWTYEATNTTPYNKYDTQVWETMPYKDPPEVAPDTFLLEKRNQQIKRFWKSQASKTNQHMKVRKN